MRITTEVNEKGFVHATFHGTSGWGTPELTPAEAIQTALLLVVACQKSRDRNQIGTPGYTDSEAINRRSNDPLGRAVKALLDIEYDGVRAAWLAS